MKMTGTPPHLDKEFVNKTAVKIGKAIHKAVMVEMDKYRETLQRYSTAEIGKTGASPGSDELAEILSIAMEEAAFTKRLEILAVLNYMANNMNATVGELEELVGQESGDEKYITKLTRANLKCVHVMALLDGELQKNIEKFAAETVPKIKELTAKATAIVERQTARG